MNSCVPEETANVDNYDELLSDFDCGSHNFDDYYGFHFFQTSQFAESAALGNVLDSNLDTMNQE